MTEIPQSNNTHQQFRQRRLVLIILIVAFLGLALGYYYSQLPEHNPQKNQSYCEQAGGEWVDSQSLCLISNKLSGEDCVDGGQCQSGVCYPPILTAAEQEDISNGDVLTEIIGTCYPEELIKGCVNQVNNGEVSLESLCYK